MDVLGEAERDAKGSTKKEKRHGTVEIKRGKKTWPGASAVGDVVTQEAWVKGGKGAIVVGGEKEGEKEENVLAEGEGGGGLWGEKRKGTTS